MVFEFAHEYVPVSACELPFAVHLVLDPVAHVNVPISYSTTHSYPNTYCPFPVFWSFTHSPS